MTSSIVHVEGSESPPTGWLTPWSSTNATPDGLDNSMALHWMLRVACAAEFIGHGAFLCVRGLGRSRGEWLS